MPDRQAIFARIVALIEPLNKKGVAVLEDTSFADGLEQTVAWYRENEAWWRSILGHSRHVSSS